MQRTIGRERNIPAARPFGIECRAGFVEYCVMKKFLLSLAALPLAALAAPASAQTMANADGAVGVQNRIANLEARFDAGLNAGVFTTVERNAIERQLTDLRALERSYSSNGLTLAERRTLQQRIRTVRNQLRSAGGTNWASGYGWSDAELDAYAGGSGAGAGYDDYGRQASNTAVTYDRYGRPIATNGTVYDQYGRPVAGNGVVYDRYGRPVASNGGYGQGGPYEPVSQSNGVGNVLGGVLGSVVGGGSGVGGVLGGVMGAGRGVGGVLGNVIGGGSGVGGILGSVLGRGGLRSGEVITGALGSVLGSAAGLGTQYRDNNSVYYRSDGQRVYEIDARTNTVIRVLPVQR
jgi:hypothetical protein